MLFSGGYDSLDTLEIRHSAGYNRWERPLQAIMQSIDSTALGFKNLRVRVLGLPEDGGTEWITRNIYRFPNILRRLTKVMLRNTCEPVPWEHFANIEEIDVWCSMESNPMVKLDIPLVNHLTLGDIDRPNDMVSPIIWQQLTHLTVKGSIDEDGPFVLNLPSLVSLRIINCAFDLRRMHAPKLEELTIRLDIQDDVGDGYRDLDEETPFTPRIIHIDVPAPDFPNEALAIFGTKLHLWSKVEELHLRVVGGPYLEGIMINALSGNLPEQCYPKLYSLTVLLPVHQPREWEDDEEADEEFSALKNEETEMMIRIADGHVLEGGSPMKKLELGWYVEWGDDYVESDWRVVEWRDCLSFESSSPTVLETHSMFVMF